LSKNDQEVSTSQNGQNDDPVIAMMKEANVPLTRENYLDLAYLGEVPSPFPSELEADLPEMFRN